MLETPQNNGTLNNGAPFSDYESVMELPQKSKDDAFYASLLQSDEATNPVELYEEIKIQQKTTGQSLIVEEARQKWMQEQDFVTRETIQQIIEDPELDKGFKAKVLKDYLQTNTISDKLKDKVIQNLTNNYLVENGLDQSDVALSEVEINVSRLKYEQSHEQLVENIKLNGQSTSSITPEAAANQVLTVAKKLEQGQELDPASYYSVETEVVAFWDMIIGKGPAWLKNMIDTLSRKLATEQTFISKETLAKLMPTGTIFEIADPSKEASAEWKKTWTETRQLVEEKNKTAWTSEWQTNVEDALTEMGYPQEAIQKSLLSKAFTSLGEGMQYIGETLRPDDPQSVVIPLEIMLPFLIGGGIRKGTNIYNAGKSKPTEGVIPPTAKDKSAAQRQSKVEAVREANRKAAQEANKKDTKIKVSPENKVKKDSPIVTVTESNKKAGTDLVDAIIEDVTGQVGVAAGLNRQQINIYMTDPNANIVKSTEFGFNVDESRLTQLELTGARERALFISNPDLADTKLVNEALDQIALTLNGVIPEVPMILSNSFQTYTRTPTGLAISLPFRKSPVENYKASEVIPAYRQLEESIREVYADGPDALRAGELLIQELDNLNNVINEFTPETVPTTLSATSEYIVTWRPEGNVYDSLYDSWGTTPSERFPNTVTGAVQKALYDTEVSNTSTGLINHLFTYGRYATELEKRVYQSALTTTAVLKRQQQQLQTNIKKQLSLTQQNELKVLLDFQDQYGYNQLSNNQITEVLGYSPNMKDINKFQVALNSYRLYDNAVYQLDNVTYYNLLVAAGYNKSFYIPSKNLSIDGKGTPESSVMGVKEQFAIEANDIFMMDENGKVITAEVMDFVNQRGLGFNPEPYVTKTHYIIGENGMPNQQVYRLSRNYVDPVTKKIYQYGTFGTLIAQPLPSKVLPRRPGHVPQMRRETYAIKAIPLKVTINGKVIDLSRYDLGNKRIIEMNDILTKDQKIKRAEIMKMLLPFAQTVAMRNSKRKSFSWAKEKINGNPNTLYMLVKAKELGLKEVADFRIREIDSVQGQRFRNEGIDFEVKSDPYEAAMRTGSNVGQMASRELALNQFKNEWMTTYKNDPRLIIDDNPVMSSPTLNESREMNVNFPKEASQIRARGDDFNELARQARADYYLIYNKEMGRGSADQRVIVNGIRNLSDKVGNLTENKKYLQWMAKTSRSVQRNPAAAANVLMSTVTTLVVLTNIWKQLPLQAIAPISGMMTMSGGNPAKLVHIFSQSIALMSRRAIQSRQFAKGKADLESTHDYLFEQDNINNSQIFSSVSGKMFDKYSMKGKDYDLILQAQRDSAFSQVSDHIFTEVIGVDTIANLGQRKPISSHIKDKLARYGFELGELISRDGHTINALHLWIDNNPGKNWRTQEHLSQIMFDAYRLSGSMTNVTQMAWMNSFAGKHGGHFKSFGMRMNEGAINPNSTPFNQRQRLSNMAWHIATYGSGAFGLSVLLYYMMENSGSEELYDAAQVLKKLNFSYRGMNALGDYLVGVEGERKSTSVFGDNFGLYATDVNSMIGPWSIPISLALGIMNNDVDERNFSASIEWAKKTFNISQEIAEIWLRNPNAYKDEAVLKSLLILSDFFPPVKSVVTMRQQLKNQNEVFTKTGHNDGLDYTTSEIVFKNLWGVQTLASKNLWEVAFSEQDRAKSLDAHAKRFMKIMSRKGDGTEPTYFEIAKALEAYTLVLDNKGFISLSQEHNEFVNKVFQLIGKQKTPLAEKFMNKYMSRLVRGDNFSDAQIRDFRKLIDASGYGEEYTKELYRLADDMELDRTNKLIIDLPQINVTKDNK